MWVRTSAILAIIAIALGVLGTAWIAFPTESSADLSPPLVAFEPKQSTATGPYSADFAALARGFRPQTYRSFCGPASIATVLRAYHVEPLDQRDVFPSLRFKLDTFYSGVSLAELAELAQHNGLKSELVYADALTLDQFRDRIKTNLAHEGDFVLINYDRQVLKQSGAGHISAVGAYDEARDAFLVLDEAAYRYPFTWVPATLLYKAVHTRANKRYRGVLFVQGYRSPSG